MKRLLLLLLILTSSTLYSQDTTKTYEIDGKQVDWRTKELWDYRLNCGVPTVSAKAVSIPIKKLSWYVENSCAVHIYNTDQDHVGTVSIKENDDFVLLDITEYKKGIYLYKVYYNGSVSTTNWFEKK